MADGLSDCDICMRAVQLLDCVAGYTSTAQGNSPIAIVTLAYHGEVEQPMAFSQYDAQRLLVRLATALAALGDERAMDLLEEHFHEPATHAAMKTKPSPRDPHPLGGGGARPFAGPVTNPGPPAAEPPGPAPASMCPKRPSPPLRRLLTKPRPHADEWCRRLTPRSRYVAKCVAQYGPDYRPRNTFFILGGYSDGDLTFLLGRRRTTGGGGQDGVFRLAGSKEVALWQDESGNWLSDEAWASFFEVREGKRFLHNGKQWTKLRKLEIVALAHGKLFKQAPSV